MFQCISRENIKKNTGAWILRFNYDNHIIRNSFVNNKTAWNIQRSAVIQEPGKFLPNSFELKTKQAKAFRRQAEFYPKCR